MTTGIVSPQKSPHDTDTDAADGSAESSSSHDALIMETVGYPFLTRLYAEADDPKVADLIDKLSALRRGMGRPVLDRFVDGCVGAAAWTAYQYAFVVAGKQVHELEPLILCSDVTTLSYARDVVQSRWPAGEHVLLASDKSVLLHDYVTRVVMRPDPMFAERLKELGGFYYDSYKRWSRNRSGIV